MRYRVAFLDAERCADRLPVLTDELSRRNGAEGETISNTDRGAHANRPSIRQLHRRAFRDRLLNDSHVIFRINDDGEFAQHMFQAEVITTPARFLFPKKHN